MTRLHSIVGTARWALLVGVASICAACGGDAAEAGGGGSGGTGGSASGPSSLTFEPSTTLALAPGEKRKLGVKASPPGKYPVRFALLGDADDAALDTSETSTDAAGSAHVALFAPSSARAFSVRASSGDKVAASVAVSVSASGFGALQVVPAYAGKRTVSHWVASVRTGVTCAELTGSLLEDGDLKASAPFGSVPQVDFVPVGPTLAVTLRGAEAMVGCEELAELTAGEVQTIEVPVVDIPIQLGDAKLDVTLGLDGAKGKWNDLLGVDSMLLAFSPATNDASALLDAMQAQAGDAGFQAARKTGGWDAALVNVLGGQNALRTKLSPWLGQGAEAFASPDVIRGRLTRAVGSDASAWFQLDSVGGANPSEAGAAEKYLASWQPQPDDTVALGVDLQFLPSELVALLAVAPAKATVAGASSVPAALAELASCKSVAQALVAAGTGSGQAYPGCDASCAQKLCLSGLELQWSWARGASTQPAAPTALLAVAATAEATVDDHAQPSALSGSWVGTFSTGEKSAPVTGSATAKTPAPE